MNKKQINSLSFVDALIIYKKHSGKKVTMQTKDTEIKTFARNFLRNNKNVSI